MERTHVKLRMTSDNTFHRPTPVQIDCISYQAMSQPLHFRTNVQPLKMSRLLRIPLSALLLLSSALNASAHGGGEHQQIVVAPDADWATRHMAGTYFPASPHKSRHAD